MFDLKSVCSSSNPDSRTNGKMIEMFDGLKEQIRLQVKEDTV